jgi:hypothetical protein
MADYRPPEAEALFPPVQVSAGQLAEWRRNPRSLDLVQEVRRRLYLLAQTAFSDTEDDFLIRKGKAQALRDLLGWMENSEAEILNGERREENDE